MSEMCISEVREGGGGVCKLSVVHDCKLWYSIEWYPIADVDTERINNHLDIQATGNSASVLRMMNSVTTN